LDQTIYDLNDGKWAEFLTARDKGELVEMTEAMWCYWGDVLPPVKWKETVQMIDGGSQFVEFGFAEGAEVITGFWTESAWGKIRYFCQLTQEMNEEKED